MFFPSPEATNGSIGGITLKAVDATVKGGHHPILQLKNGSNQDLILTDRCPQPPVDVYLVSEEDAAMRTALTATDIVLPCVPLLHVAKGSSTKIDLGPWKYSLFDTYGLYEVELPLATSGSLVPEQGIDESQYREGVIARFTIHESGFITQIFRTFITKPLLNLLIWITSLLPGYNLGFAIIILTLIIKFILFLPTQHAMEGQRRMQAVQPKLDALKEKYKNDPQRMSQETMRIWKEYKVNPLQSCLPMLLQFPVLIGLFFVIRDGSILELSRHLLYASHADLSWSFGVNFFGLNLLLPSPFIMPPILLVLQYVQMKLSFSMNEKKKAAQEQVIDVPSKEKKTTKTDQEKMQSMQQKMMLYGLPIMIAVFAVQFSAAVSLYWAVSTVFAIGQQYVVNRRVG